MKKALILLLVLLLALHGAQTWAEGAAPASPEEAENLQADDAAVSEEPARIAYDYDELTVGTVTPFEGSFFTGMWGNASSDLDVRMLLHGYNLICWRSEDGVFSIDPSVVSGIIVTENAAGDRTYTLTLYNDLFYSDGTPITARDYAFSMLLALSPQMAQIGAGIRPAQYIVGYDAYMSGSTDVLSGLRVLDEDTLSVTVSHDYLPFFYEMALLDCVPYPIHVIAPGCRVTDEGEGAAIVNADPALTEPLFTADLLRQTILDPESGYLSHPMISSGPYHLTAFDGNTVSLEVNDFYKGDSRGRRPGIPRLVYTVVENETMIGDFASGGIGLLNKCTSVDVLDKGTRAVAASDDLDMANYPRNGLSFISFNCERAPLDSAAVRQAIAMCLDKDGLVQAVVGGYGLRVDGYYGMGQWMVQLVQDSGPYPVESPAEDAPQAEQDAYDAAIEAWQALSMDDVPVYDFDVEAAAALLEGEGWTLNERGEAFEPGVDAVRCKEVDGALLALDLKLVCPVGGSMNSHLKPYFADPLAKAGVRLTIEEVPMQDLLNRYYRRQDRECDMFALGTNFDVVFDPSLTFMPDGETVNPYNPTGIADEGLYRLAVEMRRTRSDDVLGYCEAWVAFQQRFQALAPMIPIYSNVYFDFYPRVLQGYDISDSISWGQAIIGAYLSDSPDAQDEDEAVSGSPLTDEGIERDASIEN